MLRDIETREDLDLLLSEFYSVATVDPVIGHHFTDLDLDSHLPVITDFWEKVLFARPVYFNNPLAVHHVLHAKSPLEFAHFVRWVEIFSTTVDRLFEGGLAEAAKLRAKMIAHNMNQRLNGGIAVGQGID
jgi:hemoglobin